MRSLPRAPAAAAFGARLALTRLGRAPVRARRAQVIRICDYQPFSPAEESCSRAPFICHVYANDKCALHPEGGSYKVSLLDMPTPPAKGAVSCRVACRA